MANSNTPCPVTHLARLGVVLLLVMATTVACRSKEDRLPGEDAPAAKIVNLEQLRSMVVDPPVPEHYLAYVGTQGSYHHFLLQSGEKASRVIVPARNLQLPDTFATTNTDRRYVVTHGDSIRLIHPDDLF